MTPGSPVDHDLHELVGRWIQGWLRSRVGSKARPVEGGWEVAVTGSDKRHVETVLVEPDPALLPAYAAAAAAEPGRWLSVVTREPWAGPTPDGLRVLLDGERLMMLRRLAPPVRVDPADPSDVVRDASPVRCRVTLLDAGEPAARGTAGVVGQTAVFDQIGTEATHRRRGHVTRLMAALNEWALERGATEGVLVASVEGQALYARIGWDAVACLATYAGPESEGTGDPGGGSSAPGGCCGNRTQQRPAANLPAVAPNEAASDPRWA